MKDLELKGKKVFVALSGGVDSAVSAALLKEQGYDVTGVYMKNWSGDDFGIQSDCPWEEDQADAEAVCKHLGIPFRSFNFEKEYRAKVVEYFFDEYAKGRTPNPDVMCNKEIKFKLFLDKALKEGADLIATGHYARRMEDSVTISNANLNLKTKTYKLFVGNDDVKNQTYFLYNITQEQLSKTLFPIGHMPKTEVRKLAEKFGLPNKSKPDSQGICFIGEIDVLKFLTSTIPENPGEIRDIDTNQVVGEHKGIYFYTIGQRKGLGLGGQEIPYFIVDKDSEKNILYVGHGHDHPALKNDTVVMENIHFISDDLRNYKAGNDNTFLIDNLEAVIRYQQKPQPGKLIVHINPETYDPQEITFVFDQPQWAIASGQSLVIYKGEECIGGGVIK